MKNITKKALIIFLMSAIIFPMFTLYNTVDAKEYKTTTTISSKQEYITKNYGKYNDENIKDVIYEGTEYRWQYDKLKYVSENFSMGEYNQDFKSEKEAINWIKGREGKYTGTNMDGKVWVTCTFKIISYNIKPTTTRKPDEGSKTVYRITSYAYNLSGTIKDGTIWTGWQESSVPPLSTTDLKNIIKTEKRYIIKVITEDNGGSTGNNGGSSNNNGGSTGNNGGSSNNNGGSAGNNGGSSNNNGGSTGNNGNSSGTTEDTEVYTSELKVGDKLKFKAKSWFLRNEEYETTGKFLYNGNTFEILAIDGNYLKIKIISGENQGQETYIKYGQEAASNGYFEKVEATSTDDGTDNENSTETLDRLDLNLLGHIYKGYFNKTDAEWNELEKSEMIVQYAEDIQNGKSTVCDVVSKILTEEELNNSSISDDEFVKRLYKAFTFKEEPSSDEIKSLTNQLTSSTDKKSRSEILEMFLSSTVPSEESFKVVCKEYGIDDPKIIGNYIATKLDISDKKEEVKTYAEELYKKANINLSEQTKQQIKESIENGKATGTSLVSSVIESDEFKNLKLTDTDYLKTISKICFNEDLSSEDLSKYENLLINGTTRNEILKQFTLNSKFQTICDNLNLTKGDYIASPIKSTGDLAKEYVGNAYTQLIGKDASNIGSVSSVVSGDTTVAKMLQIYVGSTAFNNRKLSNEEYVKSLFNAALQRNPTNEEKETYVKKVESSSKLAVIDDIVKMDELKKICNQYYLTLGKYEEYDENSKKEVKETNGNVQIVRTEQTTKDGKKVIYLEDVVFDLSKKIKGDVTGDGKIGVEDAVYVLTKAVALTINDKILTEDELNYVDIDKDEMITVKDAQYMLTYYARKSAALNPTWEEVVSGKYNELQEKLENDTLEKSDFQGIDGNLNFDVNIENSTSLPAVSEEELKQIVNNYNMSEEAKNNMLSVIPDIIKYQEKYKVNAVFFMALIYHESRCGTESNIMDKASYNWSGISTNATNGYYKEESGRYFAKFNNFNEASEAVFKIISDPDGPFFGEKRYTIYQITDIWAPYMYEEWTEFISKYIQEFYKIIGVQIKPVVTVKNNELRKKITSSMWTENDCYIIRTNETYTKTGDKKQTLQEIAEKVLSNIIKHKLPYGGDYPLDTTSYLTDNPSSGIDCSAYVSAVLYEFDKDKYSRFAVQQSTVLWYPNAEAWAQEYGWTIMKQDGSITVDQLQVGDIILHRNNVEIFAEAVDSSNPKSNAYVYSCGYDWWNR